MDALPNPELRHVYRLDAELDAPVDLGDTPQGHRRIIPLTRGHAAGPYFDAELLPAGGADWQIVRASGSSVADIRYTLKTDARRAALRPVPRRTPWRPRRARPAGRGRGRGPVRVHIPYLSDDRDRRPGARLGQRRRLHRRGRPPAEPRVVRRLPGGVAMTLAASAPLGTSGRTTAEYRGASEAGLGDCAGRYPSRGRGGQARLLLVVPSGTRARNQRTRRRSACHIRAYKPLLGASHAQGNRSAAESILRSRRADAR